MSKTLKQLLSKAIDNKNSLEWGRYDELKLDVMLVLSKMSKQKLICDLVKLAENQNNEKKYSDLKLTLIFIIQECSKLLKLKEKLVGYTYETLKENSVVKQAKFLSDFFSKKT